MAEISAKVGARIRARRKKQGVTLAVLAARVGMSAATVSRIETGNQEITVEQVHGFADALGCDPIDLMEESDVVRVREIDPELREAIRRLRDLFLEGRAGPRQAKAA
jgi:transcriptional regulator with XRE-family HTH domain